MGSLFCVPAVCNPKGIWGLSSYVDGAGAMLLDPLHAVIHPLPDCCGDRLIVIHSWAFSVELLFTRWHLTRKGFPGGSVGTVCLQCQRCWDTGSSPSQEDPLEEGMETHPSILAWRIHGQRSLVGYSPKGHRVRHNWGDWAHTLVPHQEVHTAISNTAPPV